MSTQQPRVPASAPGRDRRLGSTLRAVAAVPALAVAGYLGGLATTSLWPITVETEHYSAQIRVAPSLSRTSTVHSPTVFGDLQLEFQGPLPAPGVDTRIQVKPEISELFTLSRVDVAAITPKPAELRVAVTDGLQELAWKFGLGAVATELLLVGMWALGRRRIRWRRAVPVVVTGGLVAMVVPAAAGYLTYRTDNLLEFRATGLLGTVTNNGALFTDITHRADVGGQYVRNLLALSAALQEEFVPVEAQSTSAARFLLVSDVHGMNYYPLMRQIIDDRDIDAVIDTGDLLNFGRAQEGEIAGIYEGIESLGVPYVFVRGNHDATSRTDENVLRRLAQVPNVYLLEPTGGQYQEVVINGVRISGFNDWRYFAETAEDPIAVQVEAAERYAEAAGDNVPDIVVGHEPYAVELLETSGVRLNGHMHVADLVGDRIQVGSFTGGGLLNHFQLQLADEEQLAGELVGAPYAFDVLAFDESCSVQSLTRYTYRNLVSGRPEYQEVSLVNGARVAAPAEEGRRCGPGDEPEVRQLPSPQGAGERPPREPRPLEDSAPGDVGPDDFPASSAEALSS